MNRIWIRGTSGSGKTTLAEAVGRKLGVPAVDLDDLYWLPDWQIRPFEEFRERVAQVAAQPQWAVAGNYRKVKAMFEERADIVVWLDYPLPVTFWRVLRRTALRCLRNDRCCNGNRESFRTSFFSRKSVIWWSLTTYRRHRQECRDYLAEAPPPGQTRLRHRSPCETQVWLDSLLGPKVP